MTEATSRPISRRTVAKGAAWTAPVILGGVAAPAYAASLPPVFPELNPGGTCKHSNESKTEQRYHVGVTWRNTLPCATTVTVTAISVVVGPQTTVTFTGLPTNFNVVSGDTANRHYDSLPTPNMANGTATVTYTFTDCNGDPQNGQVPLTIDTLKPCQSGIFADWPHG